MSKFQGMFTSFFFVKRVVPIYHFFLLILILMSLFSRPLTVYCKCRGYTKKVLYLVSSLVRNKKISKRVRHYHTKVLFSLYPKNDTTCKDISISGKSFNILDKKVPSRHRFPFFVAIRVPVL